MNQIKDQWCGLWMGFCIGVALLLALLAAPPIFNGLVLCGRSVDVLHGLREIEFEGVASRVALVLLVLSMIPVLREAKLYSRRGLGLTTAGSWGVELGLGALWGILTLGGLYLAGHLLAVYHLAPDAWTSYFAHLPGFIISGLIVAYIEEALFRGAMFGVLRKGFGLWVGAVLSSLFFAVVHFAKPKPDVGVVYGHWDSGLKQLPHMLNISFSDVNVFPFILTLFVMGLTLCLLYEWRGNLFMAIGAHAGWIWIIRSGHEVFDRDASILVPLFGFDGSLEKSYITLFLAVVLFAAVAVLHLKGRRGEVPRTGD